MPTIALKNIAAGTPNALDGLQFQNIPPGGALVTLYASTPTAGGSVDYSVGTERFLSGAELNIEGSADVVSTDADLVMLREPVPAGKQFLAVNAQIGNLLVIMEYTARAGRR